MIHDPGDETPLPCPWCDSETKIEGVGAGRTWFVACQGFECAAEGPCAESKAKAVAMWNSVRRSSSSPSVPTDATAESVAAEARDLLALIRLAAMDGYNPTPVSTVDDWLEECKKRLFVFYLSAKEDALHSSEEAANSDTDRLNWLDKWAVRIGLGDTGVYSFVWVDANGNESELPEADLYERYENIRKAIDAARVPQGEDA